MLNMARDFFQGNISFDVNRVLSFGYERKTFSTMGEITINDDGEHDDVVAFSF